MRLYPTPDGKKLPSVTSIQKEMLPTRDKAVLQNWNKKNIESGGGGAEAARQRGTAVHEMRELFMDGRQKEIDQSSEFYPLFECIIPALQVWEKEFHVWCEKPMVKTDYPDLFFYDEVEKKERGRLWSDRGFFAGCPDDFGVWDGQVTLSDFKTSGKPYFRNPPAKINRGLFADAKRWNDGTSESNRDKVASVIVKEYCGASQGFKKFKSTCAQLAAYEEMIMERLSITPQAWLIVVSVLPDPLVPSSVPKLQLFRITQQEMDYARESWQDTLFRFHLKFPEFKKSVTFV